ncbi:MAG: RNA polymerase sigma factor [Actinobacteria bacterium]|nr:RNA polymerase sigma factor [Actinomycetota bacterium]
MGDAGAALLSLYEQALPRVYGYLLSRCGRVPLAQDLTAQTFLAAVGAVRGDERVVLSVGWLIGVARHKLIDHWRAQEREERGLRLTWGGDEPEHDDPWDAELDALRARATLARLSPRHRAALTLRYFDDLPVAEVATHLQRSVHATEGLLVRARAAFRRAYTDEEPTDG